jgi:hypothetical protein
MNSPGNTFSGDKIFFQPDLRVGTESERIINKEGLAIQI